MPSGEWVVGRVSWLKKVWGEPNYRPSLVVRPIATGLLLLLLATSMLTTSRLMSMVLLLNSLTLLHLLHLWLLILIPECRLIVCHLIIGVDLGGQPGHAPPNNWVGGAKVSFCPPPIIQVRIFENIETTSETKTRNLTTTIYHNKNNYFNYLHPIIFKIFKPSLSAKLTC